MNQLKLSLTIFLCVMAAGFASAAAPALINYQGVLRDASGDPENGAFDMVFRFFDKKVLGSEMLVDQHIGAQAVTVSGGLFNAQLGGGLISPGGGNPHYSALDAMFGAEGEVWLEVAIQGETLSPRVRVISAAYALNASTVDGLDSGMFLRSDMSDSYDFGTLTTQPGTVIDVNGDFWLNGTLVMDHDGPDGAQAIYFYNSGTATGASIQWDDVNNRFSTSNGLYVNGLLRTQSSALLGGTQVVIGENGPDQDRLVAFYEDGNPQGEFLLWDDSDDMFHFSDDTRIGGNASVSGNSLSMGGFGAETTQSLFFFNGGSATGESIAWDDAQDRFEVSDELVVATTIRTGSLTAAPVAYNTIGGGTPESADIAAQSDLYVGADLEVGSQIYFSADDWLSEGNSTIRASRGLTAGANLGAEGQRLFLDLLGANPAYFEYQSFFEQFTLTEDLDIWGEMQANTKNFVQNHPHDDSLSIVYTTLEGPEASTFTRGSGRLEQGLARVRLDETFAWVTDPDLGLTVTLTPRGQWSDLYVESVSTEELVVRSSGDTATDAAFDYLVLGLRIGYKESPVVRPRKREALLPVTDELHARIAGRPELARYTPLARYQEMSKNVTGHAVSDFSAGEALRSAVGVGDSGPVLPSEGALQAPSAAGATQHLAAQASAPDAEAVDAGPATPEGTARQSFEDAQGNLYARSFRTSSGAFDAIAPLSGQIAPGDVLALDESGSVRRADLAHDVTVVGIAMGDAIQGPDGVRSVPFAVAGVVSCHVDASHGGILPGDLLVSSPTPGHAMRADDPVPGTILGKALEPLGAGTGVVRVLVTLR